MSAALLVVEDLRTAFKTKHGLTKAVDGVSLEVGAGETLGIVGESGCGKSVTALSIMRLEKPGRITGGRIMFEGRDLTQSSDAEMRQIRGTKIAMIFQDPMTSLNPVFPIGWQVAEPNRVHHQWDRRRAAASAIEYLDRVGIPDAEKRTHDYPHEFSGGMRQRAMIAMALSTEPKVLIADEPTTALDVTIQAQILDLLRKANTELGTATILITHNLGVVAGMCKRVIVMYAGKVVEAGPTADVFRHPRHPYTWALLKSVPRLDAAEGAPLKPIDGSPPNASALPPGCAFHPRCPVRLERCVTDVPALGILAPGHSASCWFTQEGGTLAER